MTESAEEILRVKYCSYRHAHGKKKIYIEIPVFSRSVDLVELDSRSRKITAIEFKIKDWKRAISQLCEISLCFDYLILCIPKPKTQKCIDSIKAACTEKGIGLILWDRVNDNFEKICEPITLNDIWKAPKKQILNYLKEREEYYE